MVSVLFGGLPPGVGKLDILNMLIDYGVQDVYLVHRAGCCESLGFGRVEFEDNEGAAAAMDWLNGCCLIKRSGKLLAVECPEDGHRLLHMVLLPAQSARQKPSEWLLIENLPVHWTRNDIYDTFRGFGWLLDVALCWSSSGEYQGVAVVRYSSKLESSRALRRLNNVQLPSASKLCTIKYITNNNPAELARYHITTMSDSEMAVHANSGTLKKSDCGELLAFAKEKLLKNSSAANKCGDDIKDSGSPSVESSESAEYRDFLFVSIALEL